MELRPGAPIVVGRSDSCDIVVDDRLASREHCRLHLEGERVLVTDLGSKNQLLVNGLAIQEQAELHHEDKLFVGSSQITIVRQMHPPRSAGDADSIVPRASSGSAMTRLTGVLEILASAAHTSLAEGDLSSAETSTRNLLVSARGHLARGRTVAEPVLTDAVDLSLSLAARLRESGWLDRAIEVFVAASRPIPLSTAERMHRLCDELGGRLESLPAYLELAKSMGWDSEPSAKLLRGR